MLMCVGGGEGEGRGVVGVGVSRNVRRVVWVSSFRKVFFVQSRYDECVSLSKICI